MTKYKHTQVGYLMMIPALILLAIFTYVQITSRLEPVSTDSGTNFAMTLIMIITFSTIASFVTLTTSIDKEYIQIKFGYGIFTKKFKLDQITKVQAVKNHWYHGWGIRLWLWPKMWIFNVSGFNAVEITMNNGSIYRIGTDRPKELEVAIKQSLKT